jgi:hypothetical protein
LYTEHIMRALLALVSVLGLNLMSGEAEAAPRGGKSGLEAAKGGKAHGKSSDKDEESEEKESTGKGGKKKGPGKAAANPGSKPSTRAPGKGASPRSSLPEKDEETEEEKVAGSKPNTGGKAGTKPGSGKPRGQRPGQGRPGEQEVGANKPWQNKPGESEESEVVKAPNRGVEARPMDPRAPRQPGMPGEEEAPTASTSAKAPERKPQQPHLETTSYLHGVAGMNSIGIGGEDGAMLAGLEGGVEGWEVGGSQLVTRNFNLRASADRTFAETQVDRLQVSAAVGAWARVIGAQVGPAIDFSRAGTEEAEVGLGLQAVGLLGGPTASLWAGVKPVLVDATGQDQELQLAGVGGLSMHMNNLSMGVGAEARDGGGSPELKVSLGLGFAF